MRNRAELWGELLRGFLFSRDEQSGAWWRNHRTDLIKQTLSEMTRDTVINLEQKTKDAEALSNVLKQVRSYIEQSKSLRGLTQSQLRSADIRRKLGNLESWHQNMPEGVNDLLKMIVCHKSETTKR